jgi:hypothetical protein
MERRPSVGLGTLRLLGAVAVTALASCGNRTLGTPRQAASTPTHVRPPVNVPDSRQVTSALWYDQPARTDLFFAWYAAARDDPNPKPRLQLVESWAQQARPDSSLDLLTNALVDPDETVRARAQELMEQALAARAEAR